MQTHDVYITQDYALFIYELGRGVLQHPGDELHQPGIYLSAVRRLLLCSRSPLAAGALGAPWENRGDQEVELVDSCLVGKRKRTKSCSCLRIVIRMQSAIAYDHLVKLLVIGDSGEAAAHSMHISTPLGSALTTGRYTCSMLCSLVSSCLHLVRLIIFSCGSIQMLQQLYYYPILLRFTFWLT